MTTTETQDYTAADIIKMSEGVYEYAFMQVSSRESLGLPPIMRDLSGPIEEVMKDDSLTEEEKREVIQTAKGYLIPSPTLNLITLPNGLAAADVYGTFHNPLSAVLMQALEMQPKNVSPFIGMIREAVKALPIDTEEDKKTQSALIEALLVLEKREAVYKDEPEEFRDFRIYAVTDPEMVKAREAILATRTRLDEEDDAAYQAAESLAEEIDALREEATPYCQNVEMVGIPKNLVNRFISLRSRVEESDLSPADKAASIELLSFDSLGKYAKTSDSINGATHSGKITPSGLILYTSETRPTPGDDSAHYLSTAYAALITMEGLHEKDDVRSTLNDYFPEVVSHCKYKTGDNKGQAALYVAALERAKNTTKTSMAEHKKYSLSELLNGREESKIAEVVRRAGVSEHKEGSSGDSAETGSQSETSNLADDQNEYREALSNIESLVEDFRSAAVAEYCNLAYVGYSDFIVRGSGSLVDVIAKSVLTEDDKKALHSKVDLRKLSFNPGIAISETGLFIQPFMAEDNEYRAAQMVAHFITACSIAVRDDNKDATSANLCHINDVLAYVQENSSADSDRDYLNKMLLCAHMEILPVTIK